MVASRSVFLNKKSQSKFIQYYNSVQDDQNTTRDEFRARLERVDRDYQRELDQSKEQARAKAANRAGDNTRFQNLTIPIVMPQVEAAVVHQTLVYLTGDPLFGVVSSPKFVDEALMLQTKIEDESVRGGWARELIMFFRSGFKYNFAPVEVDWGQEVTYTVETDLTKSVEQGVPKEVIWSGNRLKNLDPYNTFVDPRVPASEVYRKGEYGGYTDFISRIELKSFIARLPDKITSNIIPAFESGLDTASGAKSSGAMNYYVPDINPDVAEEDFKVNGTDWMRWASLRDTTHKNKIDYKDGYEITVLYAKVLPSEFGLSVPNRETPQIYKLIIINHSVIIYCEQQTNAHAYLPILIGQPKEDGLRQQTKSLADNGAGFQHLATAYMGSIIASKRRAVSDRVLYDPSRVTSAAINSANPSAKIPVRPAAFGKNVADAVFQFPYREDQNVNSMQQISTIVELSNQLAGQNRTSQGQFTKGNRTLEEFNKVQDSSDGNDQLASILLQYQVFIPLKHILKLNILQFQGGTTVYNRDEKIDVEIDPVKLRKAVLEFRLSDGLIPASKIISGESWSTAIQVVGSSPQIGAGYNIAPMFSYLMKTQGADLTDFEKSPEQVAFEQALGAWQALTQLALEKGRPFDQPQPLPEQFGYDPSKNKQAPKEANTSEVNTPANQSITEL